MKVVKVVFSCLVGLVGGGWDVGGGRDQRLDCNIIYCSSDRSNATICDKNLTSTG